MDPHVVVSGGVDSAPVGSCLLHAGAAVEKAAVRWLRVLVSVMPVCPTNSTFPKYFWRAAIGGGVLLGLLRELHVSSDVYAKANLDDDNGATFLVEGGRVWRGGSLGPPRIDHIRRGTVPCKEELLGLLIGRPHPYIRREAVVHYASPSATGRPRRLYMGSWETSMCRLWRMSSVLGGGASYSGEGFASRGRGIIPPGWMTVAHEWVRVTQESRLLFWGGSPYPPL